MSVQKRKPAWFVLYLLILMMFLMFVIEGRDGLPDWANEAATLGIVLLVFGAMHLWVRANLPNLMQDELRDLKPGEFRFIEVPPRRIETGFTNDPGRILGTHDHAD